MKATRPLALVALAWALALPAARPAAGQGAGLAQVEALLASGRITDARARLAAWLADEAEAAPRAERARSRLLAARLAPDAASAEAEYLALVYAYPSTTEAAEALLRLGQGALAAGDAPRALGHLRRLVRDYPGTEARRTGLVWQARALRENGQRAEACAAAGEAVAAADEALGALAEEERAAACAAAAAPERPGAGEAEPAAGAAGRWTVQAGAFREVARARTLADALQGAGFAARVVRVEGSGLLRVRVGRWSASGAAQDAAAALAEAGFEAVVVGDAGAEIPPP